MKWTNCEQSHKTQYNLKAIEQSNKDIKNDRGRIMCLGELSIFSWPVVPPCPPCHNWSCYNWVKCQIWENVIIRENKNKTLMIWYVCNGQNINLKPARTSIALEVGSQITLLSSCTKVRLLTCYRFNEAELFMPRKNSDFIMLSYIRSYPNGAIKTFKKSAFKIYSYYSIVSERVHVSVSFCKLLLVGWVWI